MMVSPKSTTEESVDVWEGVLERSASAEACGLCYGAQVEPICPGGEESRL